MALRGFLALRAYQAIFWDRPVTPLGSEDAPVTMQREAPQRLMYTKHQLLSR